MPLNVDLDTTLTVVAGNLYRILARQVSRYETATPERIWRHFLDTPGTVHITDDAVTVDLNLRTYHPALIDAGFSDLDLPIPWWNNHRLRCRFPPAEARHGVEPQLNYPGIEVSRRAARAQRGRPRHCAEAHPGDGRSRAFRS